MSRYVVTEIEGYYTNKPSGSARVGLSCMVIDTAWNRALVAIFRTEDLGSSQRGFVKLPTQAERFDVVREQAATRCEALNRLDEIARAVA